MLFFSFYVLCQPNINDQKLNVNPYFYDYSPFGLFVILNLILLHSIAQFFPRLTNRFFSQVCANGKSLIIRLLGCPVSVNYLPSFKFLPYDAAKRAKAIRKHLRNMCNLLIHFYSNKQNKVAFYPKDIHSDRPLSLYHFGVCQYQYYTPQSRYSHSPH